jgi:tetratricopeptide (TPR) repeat protein
VERSVRDADPLIRLGATEAAQAVPPEQRVALLAPLLRDPVRAVRIEAAHALTEVPADALSPGDRSAHADALAEWRAAQAANADRPDAHVNLGALHARFGDRAAARAEYETALRIGPWFVPAYLNLADLLREEERDAEAEPLLRRAVEIAPDSADAHHALGLLLVRRRDLPGAIDALERAAELAPGDARYAYVYGVALHSAGETARAIAFLERHAERRPGDRSVTALLDELRTPTTGR